MTIPWKALRDMSYLSTFGRQICHSPSEAQTHTLIWTVNIKAEKRRQFIDKTLVLVGIGLSSDRPIFHYKRIDWTEITKNFVYYTYSRTQLYFT